MPGGACKLRGLPKFIQRLRRWFVINVAILIRHGASAAGARSAAVLQIPRRDLGRRRRRRRRRRPRRRREHGKDPRMSSLPTQPCVLVQPEGCTARGEAGASRGRAPRCRRHCGARDSPALAAAKRRPGPPGRVPMRQVAPRRPVLSVLQIPRRPSAAAASAGARASGGRR